MSTLDKLKAYAADANRFDGLAAMNDAPGRHEHAAFARRQAKLYRRRAAELYREWRHETA